MPAPSCDIGSLLDTLPPGSKVTVTVESVEGGTLRYGAQVTIDDVEVERVVGCYTCEELATVLDQDLRDAGVSEWMRKVG